MSVAQRPLIVGLGEILWDVFPDGARFGGAPTNFACTAAGIGEQGFRIGMVSAVGDDQQGLQARQILEDRHVDVSGIGCVDQPTGRVDVVVHDHGQASYEFLMDAAWDHIQWSDSLSAIARRADVVCFGTLGQRAPTSRSTIRRFLKLTPTSCIRILDVNLRPPFWTDDILRDSLPLANVLKCNDEELPILSNLLQVKGSDSDQLRTLIERYELRLAILTRGANGSLIVDQSGETSELSAATVQINDTVGAGDAFTAAVAIGFLESQSLSAIHRCASEVAAWVCTQSGATPVIPRDVCQYSCSGG